MPRAAAGQEFSNIPLAVLAVLLEKLWASRWEDGVNKTLFTGFKFVWALCSQVARTRLTQKKARRIHLQLCVPFEHCVLWSTFSESFTIGNLLAEVNLSLPLEKNSM